MSKQKFTLNTTAILEDAEVQKRFQEIDPSLRDFLVEGYNPILAKLEKLYKESPGLSYSDPRVKKLSDEIVSQLENMGWDKERIERNVGGASLSTPTQMAALKRNLESGQSLKEALGILSKDFVEQTKKDFPRTVFTLIDQNRKIVKLDNQDNISDVINDRVKRGGGKASYFEEFQKALHLTDEQLKFMLCRLNQRAIQGAGMAIVTNAVGSGPREDNLYVHVNEKGEIERVTAVENKYTVQKPLSKTVINDNGRKEEVFVENESGEVVKIPVSKISYKVDISELKGNDNIGDIILPTQKTKERLRFEALDGDAVYPIPEVLKSKTYNNIILSQNIKVSDDKVIKMIRTPGIKDELLEGRYQKLVELVTPKIVEKILQDEIDKIKKKNPKASNKSIAIDVQNNVSDIFNNPEMKTDKQLNRHLNNFLEHKDPSIITRIYHYVHAAFRGINIKSYEADKVEKQIIKVSNVVKKLDRSI